MNRHLNALELPKVLEMAAKRACNDDAREILTALQPTPNPELAEKSLGMTEDAYILLAKHGGPAFGGLCNVSNSLARASAGGMLTMKELLDIGSTVRAVRGIREWRDNSGKDELGIDLYFDSLMPNKFLEDKIFGAILTEDEMSDSASPELANIRRQIKNKENSRSKLYRRKWILTKNFQMMRSIPESKHRNDFWFVIRHGSVIFTEKWKMMIFLYLSAVRLSKKTVLFS